MSLGSLAQNCNTCPVPSESVFLKFTNPGNFEPLIRHWTSKDSVQNRQVHRDTAHKEYFLFLFQSFQSLFALSVLVGSPSRGGDVTVYVWHRPPELAHSFLFFSCVCFCLYGPFNCISFHKFSRQLSAFLLCSSGLISALLVRWTVYLFLKVSFSPDIILRGRLG